MTGAFSATVRSLLSTALRSALVASVPLANGWTSQTVSAVLPAKYRTGYTVTYQWYRTGVDAPAVGGTGPSRTVQIPGATGQSYALQPADGGSMVTVGIVVTPSGGGMPSSVLAPWEFIPYYGHVELVSAHGAVANGYSSAPTDQSGAFAAAVAAVDSAGGGTVLIDLPGAYWFTGNQGQASSILLATNNVCCLAGLSQTETVLIQGGSGLRLVSSQRDGNVVQDCILDCFSAGQPTAQFAFATSHNFNVLQRFTAVGSVQHFTLYFAGGSSYGRTDASCGTTNGSSTITDPAIVAADALGNMVAPEVGHSVIGPGVPPDAIVNTVNPGVSFTICDAVTHAALSCTATAAGQPITIGGALGAAPRYASGNQVLDGTVVDHVTDDGFSWSFQGVGGVIDTISHIGSRLAIYFCTGLPTARHRIANYRFWANTDWYQTISPNHPANAGTIHADGISCISGEYINVSQGSGYLDFDGFTSDGVFGHVSGNFTMPSVTYADFALVPANNVAPGSTGYVGPAWNPWASTGLAAAFPNTSGAAAGSYPYSGVARPVLSGTFQDGWLTLASLSGFTLLRPVLGNTAVRMGGGGGSTTTLTGTVIDGGTTATAASWGGAVFSGTTTFTATVDLTVQGNITEADTTSGTGGASFENQGGVAAKVTVGGATAMAAGGGGPGTFANPNGFYSGAGTTFKFLAYPTGFNAATPLFSASSPPNQTGGSPGGGPVAYDAYTFTAGASASFAGAITCVAVPSGQTPSVGSLAVSSSGVLSGSAPAGTYTVDVTASATSGGTTLTGTTGPITFSIGQVPTISTSSLPAPAQGDGTYSQQLVDNGWPSAGTTQATGYVVTAGALPAGLVLDPTGTGSTGTNPIGTTGGLIHGRCTAAPGTAYAFTVTATNEFGTSAAVSFAGQVAPPTPAAPTWNVDSPVDPKFAGKPYSHTFSASGYSVNVTTPVIALAGGALPPGMTWSPDGQGNVVVSGAVPNSAPIADGEYDFSFVATNEQGSASALFSINVPKGEAPGLTGTEAGTGPTVVQNWSSGQTYPAGAIVANPAYSSSYYQAKTAGSGGTAPANNATRWTPVTSLTVGSTVTLGKGSWTRVPTWVYSWAHADGTLIPCNDSQSYTPSAADAGKSLVCNLVAVNDGAWSAPSVPTIFAVPVATPAAGPPTRFVSSTTVPGIKGQPFNASSIVIQLDSATSGYFYLNVTPAGSTTAVQTSNIAFTGPKNGVWTAPTAAAVQGAIEAAIGSTAPGRDISVSSTQVTDLEESADTVVQYTVLMVAGGQFDGCLPAITATWQSGGTNYLHPNAAKVEMLYTPAPGAYVATDGYPAPAITASGLPPGLSLQPSGTISGTPTTAGSWTPTFTAGTVTSSSKIVIEDLPTVVSSAAASVTYTTGTAITAITLTAHSPAGTPIAWTTQYGSLPPGVTLADNGNGTATISGTPTANGTWLATLAATNAAGSATTALTLSS